MASQGKASTKEHKECIVRLQPSYDEERGTQTTVSTRNPAGRVAKNFQVGLATVKTVMRNITGPGRWLRLLPCLGESRPLVVGVRERP